MVIAAATAAFAYFTSQGTGSGSAGTGTDNKTLTISQIGAGYDSLVATNDYTQDQCMQGCSGPSVLGNDITLANTGDQQLVDFVVAVRNWGPAITNGPITLTINNTVSGPVSFTQDFDVPAATAPNAEPSTTNLTFNLASEGVFVQQEFVYGLSFGDPLGSEDSLNFALASSSADLTVGSDTSPGSIYLEDTNGNNNDFPACTTGLPTSPAGQLVKVVTNCGPWNPGNPGAYGNESNTADIPAVKVDVVGGTLATLYPGTSDAVNFAITNPNPSKVYVNQVSSTIAGVVGGNDPTTCASNSTSWYKVSPPSVTVGEEVPPGTTVFNATGMSLSMVDANVSQDACQGSTVNLNFTSN